MARPGPRTDQTGTGFELIITTLRVLCPPHFLGSTSGRSGHSYPTGIRRILCSGSSKPGREARARTEFLGRREGRDSRPQKVRAGPYHHPLPPSPCRSSWGVGEAQGLAQGHLLLIYPLLGREGAGEGTGPGRFAFALEKSVSRWLWGYGREWKMFSFLDPRPS